MIDHEYITLSHASKLCVGGPSPSTVWRWATKGVSVGGKRIRLKHGFQGRRMVTTRAWVREFTEACAKPVNQNKPLSPVACADADEACVLEGI